MNIGTANYVITRQIQNSNIPFEYQVNLPRNTPVGLPKAFQRKTNWKYWIKYIKPIWCPQHIQNAHVLIPSLSHLVTWKSRDDIYTYCCICVHTPTGVGHMGSTKWFIRMQRCNMEFNCHTYCSPCGNIQDVQVNINTHCDPCGHLRVLLN